MAKKNTDKVAASSHTHSGFDPHEETGKIVGPGTNPSEVKFEGNTTGPVYVHCKNGQPVEQIHDHADAADGWFVRFGGTAEECAAFATR
jgi:hypothetical protein